MRLLLRPSSSSSSCCRASSSCSSSSSSSLAQQHRRLLLSTSSTLLLQTTRHASTSKIPPLRPTGINPPLFHQTIVHSDGSTFTLRSTSPRSLLKLTKDARNHALWNPALNVVDDQSGELAKFEKRFADFDLDAFAEFDVAVEEEVAAAVDEVKPVAATPAAKGKGKKKK
ncbi:hypothetical protein HDU87_007978 [Geranomyces variabilis]|uniref:Ribosomal protein bL31m N-terminal domain-containing protein n=1 Tax=Geranomyces variabilis TaxID=109894 RepID=A0AAD5TTX3_9FUNG|nr:hypothetical protein HDU87_007978 [Geranomyces variabilis]